MSECLLIMSRRVVVASTGKRSTQDLTGVDGDVVALEGNGWVVVRTTDGSETLRVQQRYLEKRTKDKSEVTAPGLQSCTHAFVTWSALALCDTLLPVICAPLLLQGETYHW